MVRQWLEEQGYHPAPQLDEMEIWSSWYRGKAKGFHDYKIWNGQKVIKCERDTMNMAKQICQDWASLIMNEKAEITAEDEVFNKYLQEVLEINDFQASANRLIELMMAMGTAAWVVYLEDEIPTIDYVRGDMIFPLNWDNGKITECAFASKRVENGENAYYINIHTKNSQGNYEISNHLILEKEQEEIEIPDGVESIVETHSPTPLFQIIKPNIVNNVDLDSPYGISVFHNAIGRLRKVDLIFDSGNNEFSLGKKRIIVPLSMTKQAIAKGMSRPVFDPNDVAYYGIDMGDEQKPIDLTGQLRIAEHSQGLQDALNYLSDGVGLGKDRYEYTSAGGPITATQVISEQSELYRNLKKHELIIEQAIKGLCAAIGEISGYTNNTVVSVKFDDSIITDSEADEDRAIKLTGAGLKSKETAMTELYGCTEEQAKAELDRIDSEMQTAYPDFFDTF